jgi:hypothetical protein
VRQWLPLPVDEVSVKSVIYMLRFVYVGGVYVVADGRILHPKHNVSADEVNKEWKKIGSFADCNIVAQGSLRRLVDKDGKIIIEFKVTD